jgi:hypothetical protein
VQAPLSQNNRMRPSPIGHPPVQPHMSPSVSRVQDWEHDCEVVAQLPFAQRKLLHVQVWFGADSAQSEP